MLLVLLPFIIIAIAWFILWYLCTIRKYTYDFEMSIAGLKSIIVVAAIIGVLLGGCAIINATGWHLEEHVELINSRAVILAELKSTDTDIHNKGITDAIAYNQAVKNGKNYLSNPWSNWLTDTIWADAEYIEVNVAEYEILPESESAVQNENQ